MDGQTKKQQQPGSLTGGYSGVLNEFKSSSSSFGGASLPRQMEGPRPRVYPFTTLATKLLGSDADCKGLQPASCFVIQNH